MSLCVLSAAESGIGSVIHGIDHGAGIIEAAEEHRRKHQIKTPPGGLLPIRGGGYLLHCKVTQNR